MPRSWFKRPTRPTTLLTVSRMVQNQRAQNVGASGNARHVDGDRLRRDLQSENVQVDRAQVQVQHLTIRRLLHADWSVAAERRARRKLNGKFERSGEHGGENDQASPAGSVRPRTAYLMPWIPSGKTGSIAEPPPSTCRVWPVMKPACSVHIRTTALPMSAGVPRRRIGVHPLWCQSLMSLKTSGGRPESTLSSQAPGLIEFTVMPRCARATAK